MKFDTSRILIEEMRKTELYFQINIKDMNFILSDLKEYVEKKYKVSYISLKLNYVMIEENILYIYFDSF